MGEFWSLHRNGPQWQALHYSFEKAGLSLRDQPIPWNAEVVLVEALLHLPPAGRKKADFLLKIAGQGTLPPESLRRDDGDERFRLVFRLAPPMRTVAAEILWRHHRLGQLTLPYLSRDEFLRNIRLEMPTLFVRIGERSVACQTFVANQCGGIMANAVIVSPTSLVPLLDLGFQVEFRSERGEVIQTAPAQLTTSQYAERQALIAIAPRKLPRRIGLWQATWVLGDQPLLTQQIRAISQNAFHRSLRVADTHLVVQPHKGKVRLARQLPPLDELERAGPGFLVTSKEPGMAGTASFQLRLQMPGAVRPPLFLDQEVLITDGPTLVAPGTLDAAELSQVSGFELRLRGQTLGVLSTRPIPSATFTAEGGYKLPPEFTWTTSADEELTERLGRLLDERGNGRS